MGGNALKAVKTRRFDKVEYYDLEVEVLEKLKRARIPVANVIKYYHNKPTFGDMDILVCIEGIREYHQLIREEFKPSQMVSNGSCLSFDYKECQIDLITAPSDEYKFSQAYFAFNDLGILMGRIARRFGVSFGHNGLYYKYMDKTRMIKKILITRNVQTAFTYLGFDYIEWLAGFNELEDIFAYAERSKYFNPKVFLFENLNHEARQRDRKRPTYSEFVVRCEQLVASGEKFPEFKQTRSEYLPELFQKFPHFEAEYIQATKDDMFRQSIKVKFNGELVRKLTYLNGRELGEFMKAIKPEFTESFVISQTPDSIEDEIMCLYKLHVSDWKEKYYQGALDRMKEYEKKVDNL